MTRSRSLLVLLDDDDLACVEAVRPRSLSGDILVFDLDVHLTLQDRGIAHLTPYDIIRPDEWNRVSALRRSLWDFWTRHARVEFEGINLLGMARYRHRTCLARMAFVAYVIERAIEERRPGAVVVFEEPVGHGLNPPDDYHKMPVLFMLTRGIAEQHGISVDAIPRAEQIGRSPYVDLVAQGGRRQLKPVEPERILGKRPFVLFAGSGVDLIRQLPLIRRIHEGGRYAAVQLYKTAGESQLGAMRAAGHVVWHDSQVTQDAPRIESFAFVDEARAAFGAARAQAPAELRGVLANPHLKPHFDFLFGPYAQGMARHVRAWTHFFGRCRPELLVVNYVAPINDVAIHMGIPGLALTHALMLVGVDEWFLDFPGFHIGAIGRPHKDKLIAAGLPPDRIHVVGDPRIDEILHLMEKDPGLGDEASRHKIRSDLDVYPHQRMVLLLISRLATLPHENGLPITDWADAVRCFEGIASIAARRPEWRWVVKAHPRFDQPQLYERTNANLPIDRRMVVLRDEPLDELVKASDAVVVFNVVSSGLIEASFRPRPVFMFRQSMPWYWPTQRAMDGWLHVSSVDQLETELDSTFSSRAEYDARVKQTREALCRYLGGEPVPSLPLCVAAVEEILARRPQAQR